MFTYNFESLYKQTAEGSEEWLPLPLDKMTVYGDHLNKKVKYHMCREIMGINMKMIEKFGGQPPYNATGAKETLRELVSQVSHHMWWWTNAQPDVIDYMMLMDMDENDRELFCNARSKWKLEQWCSGAVVLVPQPKSTEAFFELLVDRDNQYHAWVCIEIGRRMCEMFSNDLELLHQVRVEYDSKTHADTEIVESILAGFNRPLVGCSEIANECDLSPQRVGKVLNSLGHNKRRVSGNGDNQYIWTLSHEAQKFDKLSNVELRKAWESMRAPANEPEVSFL